MQVTLDIPQAIAYPVKRRIALKVFKFFSVSCSFSFWLGGLLGVGAGNAQPLPGQLDASFDPGAGPNGAVGRLFIQQDQKILIVGGFTGMAGVQRRGIARLDGNGTVDPSFDPSQALGQRWVGAISFLGQQPDGKLVVGGYFTNQDGTAAPGGVRLGVDGSVDPTFHPPSTIQAIAALLPDGKMIPSTPLMRLNPDGSPDLTFVPPAEFLGAGGSTFGGLRKALVLQDAKLALLADFTSHGLMGSGEPSISRLRCGPWRRI